MTSKNLFQFHYSNAHTQLNGYGGDNYNMCWFKWYGWYYFHDSNQAFHLNNKKLGLVLDPERGEGKKRTQWILKDNGKVFPRHYSKYLRVK